MDETKIYVIFHKYIIDTCYQKDTYLNLSNYIFLKCNELFPAQYNRNMNYQIIFEKDMKFYNPELQNLKKPYMAVSALYHIFKNKIYQKHQYIGFLEYDLSLEIDPVLVKNNPKVSSIQKLSHIKSINQEISRLLSNNSRIIILLSARHRFESFFSENNMIGGKNLFYHIVDNYNQFFKTSHTVQELLDNNPVLGDQQSFLADQKTFESVMSFISSIIEQKKVEINGFRPSYLLARYIGVTLYFLDIPTHLLSLKHLNKHEW